MWGLARLLFLDNNVERKEEEEKRWYIIESIYVGAVLRSEFYSSDAD